MLYFLAILNGRPRLYHYYQTSERFIYLFILQPDITHSLAVIKINTDPYVETANTNTSKHHNH